MNLVQPPIGKTDIKKNFFSQLVVSNWNQLPEHVKKADKTNGFKNSLDEYFGYWNMFTFTNNFKIDLKFTIVVIG